MSNSFLTLSQNYCLSKKNREIEGISAQLELLPFDEFFRFFYFPIFFNEFLSKTL